MPNKKGRLFCCPEKSQSTAPCPPKNEERTPSISFINKNGLYLATCNYYSSEYNEDILKFECFELVKE